MIRVFIACFILLIAGFICLPDAFTSWSIANGAPVPGSPEYYAITCGKYLASGAWDCFWLPILLILGLFWLAVLFGGFKSVKDMENFTGRFIPDGRVYWVVISTVGFFGALWMAVEPYIQCKDWIF